MANAAHTPIYSAAIVSLLFSAALLHGGPQHGLLLLSFCSLIVSLWLATSIAKLRVEDVNATWGWLPTIALAYLGWLLVGPFLSTYPYASFGTAMQLALLPLVLLGWLLAHENDKDRTWGLTWRLLLVCGIALAALGIIDFAIMRQRAHGLLIDANAYAALINMFLVPLTFRYLSISSEQKPENLSLQLSIAFFALAQFMSLSRGGLLAFFTVLPLMLWVNRNNPRIHMRALTLLLLLGSAYVLVVKLFPIDPQRSVETWMGPGLIETDTATKARLLIWKSTWAMIQDANMFIGTGHGTFTNYYVTYRDPEEMESAGFYAHNDYLQAMQEGGIVQLAFLISLTVLIPIALLRQAHRKSAGGREPIHDSTAGLLWAVACIALHAMINFIQFVAPISVLTGLYLARAWESAVGTRASRASFVLSRAFNSALAKRAAIVLLFIPTLLLMLDGAIFRIFDAKGSILADVGSTIRFRLLNTALALRPANPIPRVTYIQDLLNAASRASSPTVRSEFLDQAEREAEALSAQAPALASARYFRAMARAMRGTAAQAELARDDLEYVVKHVPPSTKMRLALVKIYRQLGQNDEAYRTVTEAKQWMFLERDKSSLITFAKEAQIVARERNDKDEADFWAWVYAELAASLNTG